MLKLTYHDGVQIERLTLSVKSFIRQRVILAVRTGQLIAIDLHCETEWNPIITDEGIEKLRTLVAAIEPTQIELKFADEQSTEVCFDGLWLSKTPDTEHGILISSLNGISNSHYENSSHANPPF